MVPSPPSPFALRFPTALPSLVATVPPLPSPPLRLPIPLLHLLLHWPRHMSSNCRRALLERIALRLEAEGIPYTASLDKIINEFLNEALEDVDQKEHHLSLLKREDEELIRDIEKMHSEFRCEIDKVTARSLDLNLERGRIHDEIAKQYAEITDQITKRDREIHTLQAQWEELQNNQ